jgi:hypothetical protein
MADKRLPEVHLSFEPVMAVFAGEEGITFGKMLVSNGLKVKGESFALRRTAIWWLSCGGRRWWNWSQPGKASRSAPSIDR